MAHALLLDFIHAARGAGVRISTAESLDAMRAVDLVGYDSRQRLHDTLALTLAKTAEDQRLLDEVFTTFFTATRVGDLAGAVDAEAPASPPAPPPTEAVGGNGAAGGSGSGQSMPTPDSALGRMLMQGDGDALALAMAQAAQQAEIGRIRLFTQKGLFGRRLYQAMGGEMLDMDIIRAEDSADAATRALGDELKRRRQALRDAIRERMAREYLLSAAQANRELREEMIREANLATLDEFRGVDAIVRKLARRIAAQHSRRRRVQQRGLLDVRRTLARNIRHDGVLFEPQWRNRRIDRPNVVVVCDVSGSVRAYAKFLLLFLYSLAEVLPRVRAFAFSFRLGEVTELFRTREFSDAVQETMATWGMGSTDYGLALEELEKLAYDSVDHRTTLIILGDARSNYGEPRADILRRFSERVRQVIWLNPETESRWGSGDSVMPRYKPYCTLAASARTLDDLERVVTRLLRRT
ncbi:MAG: VWA domain-containing protein [Gammaproteobacteria bacterium]